MFLPYKIGHFVIVLYATKCDGECFHMIPLGENYFHFALSTHSIIDLAALAQNARFRLLTRVPPKVHYIPHTSLRQKKVGKIRDFVDTAFLAHKPLP